ncbi:CRISPR-associated endoribonuclease Cas6 [Paludifilum halophilum]|nr:CRISPR-associated endoribonuclease Cas6 [Paludifilum halophilum]
MWLKLTLQSESPSFQLPIHYHYLVQAALYDMLDAEFADFLHNTGYVHGQRRFRLFTFSRIRGAYRILREQKRIRFTGPVTLSLHSPVSAFCRSIMDGIMRKESIRIGSANLRVVHMEGGQHEVSDRRLLVETLSPVTVYSTLFRPDGRKYTHYFHPRSKDFPELIQKNMLKKFDLVYQTPPSSPRLEIEPVGRHRERVAFYKGTVIKGYTGRFRLSADDRRLLTLALDAGIGVKGSQGFGCITPVESEGGRHSNV